MPSTTQEPQTPIFGDALSNLKDDPIVKTPPRHKPKAALADKIEKAAKEAGFTSREGASTKDEIPQPVKQRRHRTGRNEQLSLKVRGVDRSTFTDLCDEHELIQGHAFELMVNLFKKEIAAKGKSKLLDLAE